jgi:hypothetical protein
MSYAPLPPTFNKLEDVAAYLVRELNEVSLALNEIEPFKIKQYKAEPAKLKDFLIAAADGVSWNPGAGAGVYVYHSGAWHLAA